MAILRAEPLVQDPEPIDDIRIQLTQRVQPESTTGGFSRPSGGAGAKRDWRLNPFLQFAVLGLLAMVAIGAASFWASRRAGQSQAMAEVRELTSVIASTVVKPNLSQGLLDGDPEAIADLDAIITGRVLNDSIVRVKLWDQDGRIVYSDEPRLIDEVYPLDDEKIAAMMNNTVVSEMSSADGPENRFETIDGLLLEVYLPLDAPDGGKLLYESYFDESIVDNASSRIRNEFFPIIIGALLVMEGLHLLLAWALKQRLVRARREQERLLQRALDSSDLERRRIAADIHDGVVQDLVGTSFALSAAAESATNHSSAEFVADLKQASLGTRRSVQSMRSLLVDIYPPNLKAQGLESSLMDLLAPGEGIGIQTHLQILGDVDRSLEDSALAYRVIQEAVRNAFRHANPANVTVRVNATGPYLTAQVTDDGTGFSLHQDLDGHFGLRLMSDLAADAGAGLSLFTTPDGGTTIRVETAG